MLNRNMAVTRSNEIKLKREKISSQLLRCQVAGMSLGHHHCSHGCKSRFGIRASLLKAVFPGKALVALLQRALWQMTEGCWRAAAQPSCLCVSWWAAAKLEDYFVGNVNARHRKIPPLEAIVSEMLYSATLDVQVYALVDHCHQEI